MKVTGYLEIIVFGALLVLAIYNMINYIFRLKNSKFMLKLFYVIVVVESVSMIIYNIVPIKDPEELAKEICTDGWHVTEVFLLLTRGCQFLLVLVIIATMN